MNMSLDLTRFACSVGDAVRALPNVGEPRSTPPGEEEDKYQPSGAWTAFGIWSLLFLYAALSDGFSRLWMAVVDFSTFDLSALREVENTIPNLLSIMSAVIVVKTPLIIAVGGWLSKLYGPVKDHAVAKSLRGFKRHYMSMTVTVVAEELVARGLFLGVPWMIWGDRLPAMAYFGLFLLGNALWAVAHLVNFKNKEDRQVGRVLPQFLSGVFFTIIFVNFGLLGSIMVHLAFNNLLTSLMRKGVFNLGEMLVVTWHVMVAMVSGLLLMVHFDKSLFDLARWFDHDTSSFAIPGWELPHYALAAVLISSALTILAEVLQFDLHPTQIEAAGVDGVGKAVIIMILAFTSFYGLEYLGMPFDIRVLVMALVFLLVRKSASGSGMSRIFWIALPMLMFQLCAFLALGWDSGAYVIAILVAAIELPDRKLRLLDAKWENAQDVVATTEPERELAMVRS